MNLKKEYAQTVSLEHRKKFAQFFYAFPVFRIYVKMDFWKQKFKHGFRPCILVWEFCKNNPEKRTRLLYQRFEIDETIFHEAKKSLKMMQTQQHERLYV